MNYLEKIFYIVVFCFLFIEFLSDNFHVYIFQNQQLNHNNFLKCFEHTNYYLLD